MESSKPGLARLRTTPRRTPGVVGAQWGGSADDRPAPSYSASEVNRLVDLVSEKASVLLASVDSGTKRACWDELGKKMSRSGADVRRKWATIIAEVKMNKRSSPFKPYELAALKLVSGADLPSSPQLQIIPTSVCSIPANSFLHQDLGGAPVAEPQREPVVTAAPSGLTITSLSNRQVSITPVKRSAPPVESDESVQVVRVSQSVHTQTATDGQPKRARVDEAALCAQLVTLEERRLALDRERLVLDRDKLKCMQELVALLRARGPHASQANGELLASTLASSF